MEDRNSITSDEHFKTLKLKTGLSAEYSLHI